MKICKINFVKLQKYQNIIFFHGLQKQGILKEEDIAGDSQQIQAYLVQSGYLDAIVAEPQVIYGSDGIVVDFEISSGIRYNIGKLALEEIC